MDLPTPEHDLREVLTVAGEVVDSRAQGRVVERALAALTRHALRVDAVRTDAHP